jgi:hypothetical protein
MSMGVRNRDKLSRVEKKTADSKMILYKPSPGSPVFKELDAIMRKTEGVGTLLKK